MISSPVRPQSVEILRKESYLTEGQKVHIVCEVEFNYFINLEIKDKCDAGNYVSWFTAQARGSEPPAQIRWYLGESPLDNFKVEVRCRIIYPWYSHLLQYFLRISSTVQERGRPRVFSTSSQVSFRFSICYRQTGSQLVYLTFLNVENI